MAHRAEPEGFGFLVADTARLLRSEFDRLITEAGLGVTPGEARTLSHAARAGSVRQTVLADRMGVEAMTLSAYLDRLEARGLVVRTPDPADRRAKLVHLTKDADEVLRAMKDTSRALRERASRTLTPAEFDTLQALLRRVRDDLHEGREEERKSSAA